MSHLRHSTHRLLVAVPLLWLATSVRAELVASLPTIEAQAAILVQAQSGAILYEKNAFKPRPPASMTKMVTALVVVDKCELDDVATVSSRAAGTEGSSLELKAGEKIKVRELLKGLMLPSGNDAAACLAEHVAGSESKFAELMNEKANELGAVATQLRNASGLHHKDHYSCARDMAVFALACRVDPYLASIIKLESATVTWESGRTSTVPNRNRLLGNCLGCDGVKTGFTTPAGRCLAASAVRNGYSLVSVVMKSPNSWDECGKLLNWGFGQPPVATVLVKAPTTPEGVRFNAPIVEGRLHVPADEFMPALGCRLVDGEAGLVCDVGGSHLTFSVGRPLFIDGYGPVPDVVGVTWNGRAVVPAANLCRLLGLRLSFDRPTLTATVLPPGATAEEPSVPG